MKPSIFLLLISWCNVLTALRSLDLDWRESSPFILDHFNSNDRDKSEENSFSSSYEMGKTASPPDSSPDETRRNDEDLETADSVSSQTKEDPLQAILPKVKFVCKGKAEGYYADIDFDCEVFHYCKTSGFRFTFVCPPKSKFNQKQMTCDYEAKDSICTDAIKHQKQMNKQKSVMLPPKTAEKMSESIETLQSSQPQSTREVNKLESSTIKKDHSVPSETAIPMKLTGYTSPVLSAPTTLSPNYYQFTGNSDKYVSPQVFEVTPKATIAPISTTSPSPVYKKEDASNSQDFPVTPSPSSSTSLALPPLNYSGFQFNVNNENESFKPITLKTDSHKSSNFESDLGSEKVSNNQQYSSFLPANSLSSPAPAFSVIWNNEQNSFSSFKPSNPLQKKYSKSQVYLKPTQVKEQTTINKPKITDLITIPDPSTLFLPPTIQFRPDKNLEPVKQGQQFSTPPQFEYKHNEQQQPPLGYDFQDGMIMSNYELQPLVSGSMVLEKVTTTNPPPHQMLMVTRGPTSFQKNLAHHLSPESSTKTSPPAFQKIKHKPAPILTPANSLAQSSIMNDQLPSFFNSGSFTSLEDLEDMAKLPHAGHMFGLPKITQTKQQMHYQRPSHNFHTQLPHMMPFNNHGMMSQEINSHTSSNTGSFMTELNNLFSKHLTRVRPGNLLPSSGRPPPTISLPKFPSNSLSSWFSKPKELSNINLMASGSQQRPSFAEPPSALPSAPSVGGHPQAPKWGIFTSITKLFQAPQSHQSHLSGREPPMDHKFSASNQMQTVPLSFYQQQGPPRISFRSLPMTGYNSTLSSFKLSMSIDPETQGEEDDGSDGRQTDSEIHSWDRSSQTEQRKVHEESSKSSLHNVPAKEVGLSNDTIRSTRRRRQIFGLKAIETNNIPNMYPIFTSSDFNENFLMSSPSFLDTLTYLPATIVAQSNRLRPKNRPSMVNRYLDHTDAFSNPFPTVPLPTYDRPHGKSTKAKQLFIKPDIQMLPSFSAPPLKYNPQTGTFYEPIFGSEIPIHLTFSDFQRMPDNLLNKPRDVRAKDSSSSNSEERSVNSPVQHLRPSQGKESKGPKMPAKVLKYEYMYRPVMNTNPSPSRKRQPMKENQIVPLAQVTYEKVNIPPIRLNDDLAPAPKYQYPKNLPANPRRPVLYPQTPTTQAGDQFEHYPAHRKPIEESRPRFVASLNSAIDNIVQQNNFDVPKPATYAEKPFQAYEGGSDVRRPMYDESSSNHNQLPKNHNRVVSQNWTPEEVPVRHNTPSQAFIPYESPDMTNSNLNEQSSDKEDFNANEYGHSNEGNRGSQSKNSYSTSYSTGNYNDNHDHRYKDSGVNNIPATTVTPPSPTYSYRPHSLPPRPAQDTRETDHPHSSATPAYGQKLHRNNLNNNQDRFATHRLHDNRGHHDDIKKEIVVEKQWFPEAPYTRTYSTPSTTVATIDTALTNSSYSDWPVFKKHQNYLPPVNTGIKPVTLNDFEEETVVEDAHVSSSSDRDDRDKTDNREIEYAPKYPETFTFPQQYTTLTPPISTTSSTSSYYERYPTSESTVDTYSEYPSSVKNYHETKSDSEEITVKMDHEEATSTSAPEKSGVDEGKKDSRIKVFGSKFLNRHRGTISTMKPSNEDWLTSTAPPPDQGTIKPVTSYGSRVGITRAPKTRVSVHASISTSSVRKPLYTKHNVLKNEDAEESHDYKNELSPSPTKKPVIGYTYQRSTTRKPDRPSTSWNRFRHSTTTARSISSTANPTTSTSTTTAPATTSLATTNSPISTTPALFTGKVHNLATIFDTIDGGEGLEGDYDVVEEQSSERENDFASSSTTTTTISPSSSQSVLKVYSSSSAGALNSRLSGLRMKNLFGQKKRLDSSPST